MTDRKLVLIRHGQTELNAAEAEKLTILGVCAASELTSLGMLQARRAGQFLKRMELTPEGDIHASPTIRTLKTAHEILIALGSEWPYRVRIVIELKELDQGMLEGRPRNDLNPPMAEKITDYWRYRPLGGLESTEDVWRRMNSYLTAEVMACNHGPIVCVTHQTAIKAFLAGNGLIEKEGYGWYSCRIPNGSATILRFDAANSKWHLISLGMEPSNA